jgi:hypothetical protein
MKHGIESEFSWKKRKKGARHRAIGEWMKVIRTTPGIGYALAIDSRLRHHPFYRGPIKKLAASEGESPEIIWRIIWICMFAALIGRHLRNESTLRVYFDPDPYKETKGREEMIRNTLYHYLDVLKVDQPCRTMLCRKIEDRELEEFLSVADLIASSFSGSLRRDGSFSPPDDYATDILKQFGAMKTVGKEGLPVDECVFGASLVL